MHFDEVLDDDFLDVYYHDDGICKARKFLVVK